MAQGAWDCMEGAATGQGAVDCVARDVTDVEGDEVLYLKGKTGCTSLAEGRILAPQHQLQQPALQGSASWACWVARWVDK